MRPFSIPADMSHQSPQRWDSVGSNRISNRCFQQLFHSQVTVFSLCDCWKELCNSHQQKTAKVLPQAILKLGTKTVIDVLTGWDNNFFAPSCHRRSAKEKRTRADHPDGWQFWELRGSTPDSSPGFNQSQSVNLSELTGNISPGCVWFRFGSIL